MIDRSELVIQRLASGDLKKALVFCAKFRNMTAAEGSLLNFLQKEENILISAQWKGEPAGLIIAHLLYRIDNRPPQILLYSIDVLEKYRKKGIGTRLVESLLETGKLLKCGKCFVLTNENNKAAVNLYLKTGSKRVCRDDIFLFWDIDE